MGLLDNLMADPSTPQGMQMQGLFGGLTALGAALAQAYQPRPYGSPGPGLGDAFLAFSQGQQRGVMGAQQRAQMERQQKRMGLLDEAKSGKPDDLLSPEARAIRSALASLPENVRALADSEQLPGLVVQRETQRQRPMTAEEMAAAGYRPGTVAFTSDWTGGANVSQQPDTMSPEAFAQRERLTAMGRGPTVTWRDERDENGNIIGQRASTGQFQPINAPPMNAGRAMNIIATIGPRVASGEVTPGSPQFEQYVAAYTVATAPKTTFEQAPDPNNPGQVITVPRTQPALNVPPVFPNPMDILGRQQGGQQAAAPAQPAPQAAAAAPSPQDAPGVPIGTPGVTAVPPGTPGRITPDMAKKLQSGEEEARKVQDAVDNYLTVLRKHGTGLGTLLNDPRSPAAQEVLGAYERIKMVMRSEGLMNTGVLQAAEIPMLESVLLSPNTIRGTLATPDAVQARMNQFTRQVLDFYNVRREQAGLAPLQSLSRAQSEGGGRGGWSIRPAR